MPEQPIGDSPFSSPIAVPGESNDSGTVTFFRLLENGDRRLLETGDYRLLEGA